VLATPVPSNPEDLSGKGYDGRDNHFVSFLWDGTESDTVGAEYLAKSDGFVFNTPKVGLFISAINDAIAAALEKDKSKIPDLSGLSILRNHDSIAPEVFTGEDSSPEKALATFINKLVSNPSASPYGKALAPYIKTSKLNGKYDILFRKEETQAGNIRIIPVVTPKTTQPG